MCPLKCLIHAYIIDGLFDGQTALAQQGLDFAAARIQGLARGTRARRVVSSIWRRAEAFAERVVRGEREANMKQEAERKAKEKV